MHYDDSERKLTRSYGLDACANRHANADKRVRVLVSGRRQLVEQCRDCGGVAPCGGSLADFPDALPVDETAAAIRADAVATASRHRDDRNRQKYAIRAAAKPAEAADWFAWYSDSYLQSDGWRVRRKIVLMRDQYCCQMYLHGCTGNATEVHHRSYAGMREGDNDAHQPLCDLVAVCGPCHRAWTELERAGRVKVTPPRFA